MLEYTFQCPLTRGMHARPASELQSVAQQYQSRVMLDNLRSHRTANVRSVFSLVGTEIRPQDPCRLRVQGPDQDQAFEALRSFIQDEFPLCDIDAVLEADRHGPDVALPCSLAVAGPNYISGVRAVGGLAWAPLYVAQIRPLPLSLDVDRPDDPTAELGRFDRARGHLAAKIEGQIQSREKSVEGAILAAHLGMLHDEEFMGTVRRSIEKGDPSAKAILDAAAEYTRILQGCESPWLRERVLDLEDLCRHLLEGLYGPGVLPPQAIRLDRPSILAAEGLTPSAFLALDRENLKGLILGDTGTTSHTVILAHGRGLPTLSGIPVASLKARNGTVSVLDGGLGILVFDPPDPVRTYYRLEQTKYRLRDERYQASIRSKARTTDGVILEIAANIACSEEAGPAFQQGADAIGLFRTEMLFMDRKAPPDEQEQGSAYQAVLAAAGDRPVIFRTLDVGGDKPVPYLALGPEENPLLGNRGVRLYRTYETLLRTQLRALVRAAGQGRPWIMIPMVSTLDEVLWVKSVLDQVRAEIEGPQGAGSSKIPLGAMVETPAAALIVDQLCRELDFLSIGTNDLIQYLLAVDRTNGTVGPLYRGHHPSVIRAIRHVVNEAHRHGRWVGVCGEMAADPVNLPLWIGLGVDEISVTPVAVGPLKTEVQTCSSQQARALIDELAGCRTAADVTDRVAAWRVQKGRFDLVDARMISMGVKVTTKAHAIKVLADRLYVEGRTDDPVAVENALWERESTYSTGLGYGFAIPHCQTPALAADTIGVLKLAAPVDWDSLDGIPVSVVILLALRSGDDKAHLQVFADLSRCLMREEFRRFLQDTQDPQQIVGFLRQRLHSPGIV